MSAAVGTPEILVLLVIVMLMAAPVVVIVLLIKASRRPQAPGPRSAPPAAEPD